jgi:hypothetical protein
MRALRRKRNEAFFAFFVAEFCASLGFMRSEARQVRGSARARMSGEGGRARLAQLNLFALFVERSAGGVQRLARSNAGAAGVDHYDTSDQADQTSEEEYTHAYQRRPGRPGARRPQADICTVQTYAGATGARSFERRTCVVHRNLPSVAARRRGLTEGPNPRWDRERACVDYSRAELSLHGAVQCKQSVS